MKNLLLVGLILCSSLCMASENAIEVAKSHLASAMTGNEEELTKTYASEVRLLPGHQILNGDYDVTEKGDAYASGVKVKRKAIVAAMMKVASERPAPPAEKVKAMMEKLTFETLETETGDFVTDPSDPVETPDGKLHLTIQEGDALVKVSAGRDFLLFQLRKSNDQWQVVAEYVD
jgi:hypothetical protein